MVWGLVCLIDPKSYTDRSPGSWSRDRGLTECNPLVLQGWGLGTGLTTQSRRKYIVTETATKEKNTTVYNGFPKLSKDNRMNVSSESLKEATDRKVGALNTKCKTRIGFWNVKTLYQTSKLDQKFTI